MNDRIQELWDKAAESTAAYPSGQNNSWETQVNFMERFAELIVDECCLKLLNMDEKTKGSHNYYKHAALEIKEHFGVE